MFKTRGGGGDVCDLCVIRTPGDAITVLSAPKGVWLKPTLKIYMINHEILAAYLSNHREEDKKL